MGNSHVLQAAPHLNPSHGLCLSCRFSQPCNVQRDIFADQCSCKLPYLELIARLLKNTSHLWICRMRFTGQLLQFRISGANFQEAKCFLPSLATNLFNIKIRSRYFSLFACNLLSHRAFAISLLWRGNQSYKSESRTENQKPIKICQKKWRPKPPFKNITG